jgi:Flp pilus assembly protein TadG
MLHPAQRVQRRGAIMVESAIGYSITFLILLGLVVGGMGIFRYLQVASLAREGARYASVRGAQYQEETGKSAATGQDVYKSAILPKAVGLDTRHLTCAVSWKSSNRPLTVSTDYERPMGNTVSVTVTYQWLPELFFIGPITLSSTSTVQICY